jgi:beta-glucosidase
MRRRARSSWTDERFFCRILTPWFALDQASLPKIDYKRWVANETSSLVAQEVAEGALTLLKNSNATGFGLPLRNVRDVARKLQCLSRSV